MDAPTLLRRFDDVQQRVGNPQPRFELHHDTHFVVFRTGTRHVRTWRLVLSLGGMVALLAGIQVLSYSAVAYTLILLGIGAAAFSPVLVRPKHLLKIDPEAGTLSAFPAAPGEASSLSLDAIASIEGVYEITGWEGRSVVYAIMRDGERRSLVSFTGTNEALTFYACQALGYLLDCPATYTGAFDGPVLCNASERMAPVPG